MFQSDLKVFERESVSNSLSTSTEITFTMSLSPRLPVLQFIFSKHVDCSVEINETSTHTK